jgi:hypothetical protein
MSFCWFFSSSYESIWIGHSQALKFDSPPKGDGFIRRLKPRLFFENEHFTLEFYEGIPNARRIPTHSENQS